MRVMLKQKMIGLPVVAAILPVLVMFVLTSMEKKNVTQKIEDELDLLARDSMKTYCCCDFGTPARLRVI